MDWNAIKTEYITTDKSYRRLCEEYKVSYTALSQRGKKEKWTDLRNQHKSKIVSNQVKEVEKKAINYRDTLYDLAYKVASQLVTMTDNHTMEELVSIGLKPRDITGAIKDLNDALHIKSDRDIKEQDARIKKLIKDAESDIDADREIVVRIQGDADGYSV